MSSFLNLQLDKLKNINIKNCEFKKIKTEGKS